ncbi:MAG: sulfur carrier protein ThiS adenylyltransferase ThiF [Desulfovibrio sp.]|nr:sulfur carrier protein ThiS adenylyltransferase ThiF [Desulfovibrio sp.]
MSVDCLRDGLARYLPEDKREKLAAASIGIAGAGGLGSNVALLLARSGIEKMLVIDKDRVDASNLNRQQYWPRHLGMRKTEALRELLLELNPRMEIEIYNDEIDAGNLDALIRRRDIWIEALDGAELKRRFAERAAARAAFVAAASGICGIGGDPLMKRKLGNLLIVGDYQSDLCDAPPFAPRVIQAAALMADGVLEYILDS